MYISVSHLRISPEHSPELVAAFRARARLVESHDGFVDLQVWRSDRDQGELLMVSRWRTRACFKAYMKSADHRTSHDRITAALKHEIRLEQLDHMSTYEVVAE